MVGAAGFEPATLWSQTRCATRLRYAPKDYLYRLNELFYQLKDNYICKIKDIITEMIQYISKPFKWFFKLEAASGLILLFAAIAALIVSNTELDKYYISTLESYLSLGFLLLFS